jgi:hypothetical protein
VTGAACVQPMGNVPMRRAPPSTGNSCLACSAGQPGLRHQRQLAAWRPQEQAAPSAAAQLRAGDSCDVAARAPRSEPFHAVCLLMQPCAPQLTAPKLVTRRVQCVCLDRVSVKW